MEKSKVRGLLLGATAFFFALAAAINVQGQTPEAEWFIGHGTDTEEHVHEGMQTSDGGYIGIGHGIEEEDVDDMLIIKVDENGDLEWQKEFGTEDKPGTGYCIAEVSDGYIAGGALYDPVADRTQLHVARVDRTRTAYMPRFRSSTRLQISQVKPSSSRPKWP